MKKRVKIIFSLLFVLILSSSLIVAQNATDVATRGYECLEGKVSNQCSSLSTEEKIFSALALGRCKTELNADSYNNECWPSSDCSIKTTAQAILALGSGTKSAEDWLISQAINFEDINWYLQIESPLTDSTPTSCRATYAGVSYDFTINVDRTLSTTAGNCLTRYQDYWFAINSNCYNEQFQISCDKSFLTSLLYRKPTGSTFYVSESTHSAAGSGTTTEKVNSMCFADGTSCDYEGTLWASLILKNKKYNITSYLPYLVSQAEENARYVPEAFLYSLTNGFKTELLSKQLGNQYWELSGDRFYDTAVALLPFQNIDLGEKTNSKNWLKEVQDDEGCWQGNIRNTAFLLYSLWPRKYSGSGATTVEDCEAAGFYCMSATSCETSLGVVLDGYSGCFAEICCNKPKQLDSCEEQGGELCSSNQQCLDGIVVESLDTNSAKFCCTKGICGQPQASECELSSGICRTTCTSKEKISSYACAGSDICCITKKSNTALIIIIVLSFLIILTILGIVFRKKIKDAFLKFKTWLQSKSMKKGKPSPPSSQVRSPVMQRRPSPVMTSQRPSQARPVQKKSDFDDVLKKLKEIGK